MKLTDNKSLEAKAIEEAAFITVPPFANKNRVADRIFGALCRINPELDCMQNKTFLGNVFACIKSAGGVEYLPSNTDEISFMANNSLVSKWRAWYAEQKELNSNLSKEEKEAKKALNAERKAKYGFAILNGIEEPLQSWVLEPEGIYFGRGDSPINGMWKAAVKPSDVKLNTNSKNLPVFIRNGVETEFDWRGNGCVSWNPSYHYVATYDVKTGLPDEDGNLIRVDFVAHKKIAFAATSSVKKEGQEKKYAAGADLSKAKEAIVKKMDKIFTEFDEENLDTATAVYLLMYKGIRIGDKKPTRNNTKGLLSLVWGKEVKRVGNKLKFDFYGKDSVHDVSTLDVPEKYISAIEFSWKQNKQLKTDKKKITAFVTSVAPEVADVFSPKLMRTMVAADIVTKALDEVTAKYKLTEESPIALKKFAFNEANMEVAKRLNHQKGVNKAAEAKRAEKFAEAEAKLKERKETLNQKTAERKQKILELKKAKAPKEKIQKLQEQIERDTARFEQAARDLEFKEGNQGFTAGTSKGSYIDPGIVANWARKVAMPLEKIYSKSQMEQFKGFFED